MKTWLTEKINKPVLSHIRILSMERHDIDGAVVRRLFVFLKGNLIFDHLLDELIQRDILNKRDIDDYICNGNCKCFKIERLIKRIIWKKRCSDFVKMIEEMPRLENIAEKIRDTKENTLRTVEDEMQGNHVLTTNDEMLQKHFGFLYMKLEPREVAHLLFQSGYISVDEHDEVIERNRKIGRLKSLLAILKKDKLYTQFVCTLQSLECNSVLETLQRNEQLESHIGEYELYIQHNFILLQTELPDPDLAKVMMEHELDKSNISDIESCGGKTRQISKLLKILLMKGTPSCKELLRVIKFHLKGEKLIQRLKDISTDKKKRGKPDLCPERRSLNISWLQENEEVIISELDPLYVCDLLFEDRAIEIIEHDTITELKLRKEQVRSLLKTVKENKNDLFHFFLYILQNVYNSIGKKHEKSVQAAESSENIECSASHGLRKLPDDVQNELIEVKLKADHGSQGEQVLQNIHHSTGISEESISCGQMYVEKVSKGSVVLQLRPVTDQAVKTLLNARENNRLVEMITGMLQKADIAKIMDGTMPFEITVQVKYAKPENPKSVKEISRTALIKHRMKANKNVLVYELESTALVSVLRDSKAFDKLAIEFDDKVTNNDDRVETLLSLVDNGNSDVVEEFLSALKDLNYCHIVELIDPADIHTKAELIREKITSNYKNILEEMQFTFAREVLSRCIGDVDGMGKKILPKNGNRRERMSTFLQFILQEDYNVIEFENILKNNGLGDLLKMGETIQREHTPAQDIEVTVVKDHIPSSLEEVLFESVITLSFSNIDKANKQNLGEVSRNTSVGDQKKDTERSQSPIDIQETHLQGSLSEHKMTTLSSDSQIDGALLGDLDLTETDESSMIDWESVKSQKDEPEPKHYAPKKRLQPKPRPTFQAQGAIPPKKIFGRSGEDTSKDSGIGSPDMSSGCSDEYVVRRLFVFIKDNLIFESLQDGLMQKKLLSEREKEGYVCSNCARHYWNERLLKLFIRKKRCKEFVAFIHQMACHKHVSQKIMEVQEKARGGTLKAANGAVQRKLNFTLTHKLLQRHFACLYMELEPREIADEMFQAGHLTVFDHDYVTESNQRYERLDCLLNILIKKELYAQFVCTLQSLGYMSVLDTLQKDRKLKNKPSEYSTCIQHNFILLQENIPCFGDARFLMEHELDSTNISDIESCKNAVRKISKLLKILLIRGKSACREFFRVMEVDLKSEDLIQKMKYKSAEIKRRGRPNLNQRHRSLKTQCLQEHEEFLNEELEPLDICDLLFEERVMEIFAHDKITETSRRQKQIKYLLETVNRNENDCFHFFLYILQKEGYESILEELKKSAPGAVGAVSHEQSDNLRLSLRVATEPDDVGNGDIHMRLSVGGRTGPQVEQALQDSHSSGTEILEEAILHGVVDIRGVSSGSIVLQLRPVTDQTVQTLLNVRDNNRLVEMIVGMLKKVNIASMMDGTEPLEIKVQVYKANPVGAISKAEDAEPIKKRLKAHRNVLISELEPRAIAHVLSKFKAFAKSAIDSVLNADSCNDRVETLLSMVEDGDSEIVKEFVTALKDLGYISIVELIDPPDIHNRAENIRKMMTSNYKNILEEMQMKLAKETLSKCVGDVDEIREKILPKNGNRKKRMSSFLQFILQDDHNVIEFEKMLKNNDLEDLLKIDENVQGEHIPTQGIEMTFVEDQIHSSSEGVLFEAVITLSHTDINRNKNNPSTVPPVIEKHLDLSLNVAATARENNQMLKSYADVNTEGKLSSDSNGNSVDIQEVDEQFKSLSFLETKDDNIRTKDETRNKDVQVDETAESADGKTYKVLHFLKKEIVKEEKEQFDVKDLKQTPLDVEHHDAKPCSEQPENVPVVYTNIPSPSEPVMTPSDKMNESHKPDRAKSKLGDSTKDQEDEKSSDIWTPSYETQISGVSSTGENSADEKIARLDKDLEVGQEQIESVSETENNETDHDRENEESESDPDSSSGESAQDENKSEAGGQGPKKRQRRRKKGKRDYLKKQERKEKNKTLKESLETVVEDSNSSFKKERTKMGNESSSTSTTTTKYLSVMNVSSSLPTSSSECNLASGLERQIGIGGQPVQFQQPSEEGPESGSSVDPKPNQKNEAGAKEEKTFASVVAEGPHRMTTRSRSDHVEITFHAIASKKFVENPSNNIYLRFALEEMKGFQTLWKTYPMHNLGCDGDIAVTFKETFPKQRIQDVGLRYCYCVSINNDLSDIKNEYVYNAYKVDENNLRDFHRKNLPDVWIQYDGVLNPLPEKSAFQKLQSFVGYDYYEKKMEKNIAIAAKYFFPKWKHFFVNGMEFTGVDMIRNVDMLCEGLMRNVMLCCKRWRSEADCKVFLGKVWIEDLKPKLDDLEAKPDLISAVGIICLWEKFNLPLNENYKNALFRSLILEGNDQDKNCPMYDKLKESFRGLIPKVKNALQQFIKNEQSSANPTWICSLPLYHLLLGKLRPYEEMNKKSDHNAKQPLWWGKDDFEIEMDYLKGKTRWSIEPEKILETLAPMFEIDFYLPRAFMSVLRFEKLSVVKTKLLPPEVGMAGLYFFFCTEYFSSEINKKIAYDCLDTIADQMRRSCKSSENISQDHLTRGYLCVKIGVDLLGQATFSYRTNDKQGLMLRTIEVFVVALAVYDQLLKKRNNAESKADENVHLLALRDKKKLIDDWLNKYTFYPSVENHLKIWNRLLSMNVPESSIKDALMNELKDTLQKKLNKKSTDIKEHLISLYCNDDDQLFQPAIQEIIGNIAFEALERGCVCEERVLSGRGAKKYGSMLSRLFERSWEKNHLSDSNYWDIINFTLSWKPFVQFLDMFYQKENSEVFTTECQVQFTQATSILHLTLTKLLTGQIEIGDVLLIDTNKEAFYDLINIIWKCEKKVALEQELIFQTLKLRCKEIEKVKDVCANIKELVLLCQHFNVDLAEIDRKLESLSKMDSMKICEVCRPGILERVSDVNAYEPIVTVFELSPDVVGVIQKLKKLSEGLLFLNMWIKQGQSEEAKKQGPLTLDEVMENVWQNVHQNWTNLGRKIAVGDITFKEFQQHFKNIPNDNLEEQLKNLLITSNKDWIKERLRQFNQYRVLEQCVYGANVILKVVQEYKLEGDFQPIKMIEKMVQGTDTKMNEFDSSLIDACDVLRGIKDEHAKCLEEFINCKKLIDWLRKSMESLKELKVFVDLASISAGEGDMEVAKVKCLHAATTGYAPLIFNLGNNCDYSKFLEQCKLVWKELKADPDLPIKLKATNQHLEWLNSVKSAQGSVEVTSMRQAEAINSIGIYMVGKIDENIDKEKPTIDDVLQLHVQKDEKGSRLPRRYQYKELQELQSKLMLVAGKAEMGKDDVDRFTIVYDAIVRLCNVYIKLVSSGCVLFSNWQARFLCDPTRKVCAFVKFGTGDGCTQLKGGRNEGDDVSTIIPRLAKFMEVCLEEWLKYIDHKRDEYQHLNFFTIDQMVILQKELVLMGGEVEPSNLIYPLLSIVKHDCTKMDLIGALKKAKGDVSQKEAEQEVEMDDNEEEEEEEDVDPDEEDNTKAIAVAKFIEEIVNSGYSDKLAREALKSGLDPDNIEEGIVWCIDHEDLVVADMETEVSEDQVEVKVEEFEGWTKPGIYISDITQNILSGLQYDKGTEEDTLLLKLEQLWSEFLSSISSSVSDYLSVEHLGIILRRLAETETFTVSRLLIPGFERGAPNLLLCPQDEILNTVLTIYSHDPEQPLPQSDEILMCTPHTTLDEVEIFWRRAVFDTTDRIHCLVSGDLLDYEVSDRGERRLDYHMQRATENGIPYKLVVVCSTERENHSRIVAALDKYRRPPIPLPSHEKTAEYIKEKLTFNLKKPRVKPSAEADNENCTVRVVKSWRAGVGKTLHKKRVAEKLESLHSGVVRTNKAVVSIPLHEREINIDSIMTVLLQNTLHPGKIEPRLFHIDLSHEVQEGVDYLLFQLLILGCLTNSTGHVWRKLPYDLYIVETMPLLARDFQDQRGYIKCMHRCLDLLPDVACRSPLESVKKYQGNAPDIGESDLLFDDAEFRSSMFQRPFQYLYRLDMNRGLGDVDMRRTEGNRLTCLQTLLKHCGIPDPSWAELRHFVWFLNTQLVDFESSAYLSQAAAEDLPGFAQFVLRFLIQMSRDFATRSLNMSEESPIQMLKRIDSVDEEEENDEADLQQFQLRRTWESSPHPYLFFNMDRITMTFLGFNIERQTGNLVDAQTGKLLETGIMQRNLQDALTRNRVPINENFDSLPREEKLSKLCSVMGVDVPYDPDPTYELTTDNVKKILAIYMRFRCDIPVIIMGETGCGKTRLVKFMCQLQCPIGVEVQNMVLMKVHGGTRRSDIIRKVEEAERIAQENTANYGQKLYTVLFFDEANTTEAIGLIKEIMCDHAMEGEPLKLCQSLKIVAACNPYRKHSEDLIKRLEQAGLGYHVDAEKTTDRMGRVPMRRLVYRVQPLPQSMLPLVWDFGQLDTKVEEMYIKQMVLRYIRGGKLPNEPNLDTAISHILTSAQEFMRSQRDECSFVSLRDVERVLEVMSWFYRQTQGDTDLFDLMEEEEETDSEEEVEDMEEMMMEDYTHHQPVNDVTKSLVLALGVCYQACLKNREEFREEIVREFRPPCVLPKGPDQMADIITRCQDVFLEIDNLGANIAKNQALRENVFMMVVCIELRIPLFLVGKPGSSKSLAKTIVADAMQGNAAHTEVYRNYKQVQMVSFQCSPLSVPEGIVGTFRQCAMYQKDKDLNRFVSVVVLDEVGLAEDSPRMPLKTLHPLLEDGCQGDETPEEHMKVAFIGISNWALDPAKMNRGILVQREVPDLEELIESADGICSGERSIKKMIKPLIEPLAESYLEVFGMVVSQREFYGLRDFYSLIKMVYSFAKKNRKKPTWLMLQHCIKRNFGGFEHSGSQDPLAVFSQNLHRVEKISIANADDPDISPAGLIEACLKGDGVDSDTRYLLLLTENYGALTVLQQKILTMKNAITIFGSSFPSDQEYTQVCRNINRIKVCMETGNTVVLLNLENLYESLYDALNQYYVYFGGERYVDLGLGTHRVKCRVHKKFRLIVVAEKNIVYSKFPIPLINRLEKHFLNISTMLSEVQVRLADNLQKWAEQFVKTSTPTHRRTKTSDYTFGDVFMGYHADTCASIILLVSQQYTDDDLQGSETEVLKEAKKVLLWCATPDGVLRAKKTLPDEYAFVESTYHEQQMHDNLLCYLNQKIKAEDSEGLYAQVTTNSKLITTVDVSDLSRYLHIPKPQITLLTLQSFDTEQQFCRQVKQSFERELEEESLLIVQCDSGNENASLVACAQYCVLDQLQQVADKKIGKTHIVFIIHLPRVAGGGFTGFQCGLWHSVHIDDLRPDSDKMPSFMEMKNKSVGTLLENATGRAGGGDTEDMDWEGRGDSQPIQESGEVEMMESQDVYPHDFGDMVEQTGQVHVERKVDIAHFIKLTARPALAMVKDPEDSGRTTERVKILLELLNQEIKGEKLTFMGGIGRHLAALMKEKEETMGQSAESWLYAEATKRDCINSAGTFRKARNQCIIEKLSPILAGIIAQLDTNSNLDLLIQKEPSSWEHKLWLEIINNPSATQIEYSMVVSPKDREELPEVIVKGTGFDGIKFKAMMPFSWLIYRLIDQILRTSQNIGKHVNVQESVMSVLDIIEKTTLGKVLQKCLSEVKVMDCLKAYLSDFVHMVYHVTSQEEHGLVCENLLNGINMEFREGLPSVVMNFVAIHAVYSKTEPRLRNFASITRVWPDCSERIIEFQQKSAQFYLVTDQEMTLDVLGLFLLLKSLEPNKDSISDLKGRQLWQKQVHKYRPVVERILGQFVTEGHQTGVEEFGRRCMEGIKEARYVWTKVVVMKLFLQHVCSDEMMTVERPMTLWVMLKDNVDFKNLESLEKVEKFLKICMKNSVTKTFGRQEDCKACESEITERPVQLPCKDIICVKCFNELAILETRECPVCQNKIPAYFNPRQDNTEDLKIRKLNLFKSRCNSFFMDLVSQLCFSDDEPPSNEVVQKLMSYITATARRGQGGRMASKEMSVFEEGIDPTPVLRSFLLQHLLRTSSEQVQQYLAMYLQQAEDLMSLKENEEKMVELCLLIIQCVEDSFNHEVAKSTDPMKYKIRMATQMLQYDVGSLVREGLDVEKLYCMAQTRFGLTVVAEVLHKLLVEKSIKHSQQTRKLLEAAGKLCDECGSRQPKLFLIKHLCRCFGVETYQKICKTTDATIVRWLSVPELQKNEIVECSDRFIVCGDQYKELREKLTQAALGQNMDIFDKAIQAVQLPDHQKRTLVLLAVMREITMCYLYPENKRRVTPAAVKQLHQLLAQHPLFSNQDDLPAALCRNAVWRRNPQLTVQEGMDLGHQSTVCLLNHFFITLLEIPEERTLVEPLNRLVQQPQDMQNSFLPTMPQDDVAEIKEALLAARKGGDENPVFYRCPNGHPYVIGNCGRPYYRGRCKDCGADIGGERHQLLANNQLHDGLDQTATGHVLGRVEGRQPDASPERGLSPIECAIVRLFTHMAMYLGANINQQAIQSLIKPDLDADNVLPFLWAHIEKDLLTIQRAVGRSVDDVYILIHIICRDMMRKHRGGQLNQEMCVLANKAARQKWEADFAKTILSPVLKEMTKDLKSLNEKLANDQRLGSDPLLCLLFEINVPSECSSPNSLHNVAAVWRYRSQITMDHLLHTVQVQAPTHKVLLMFLQEEKQLRAIRLVPSIMKLQKLLIQRFQRKLDRGEALTMTIGDMIEEYENEGRSEEVRNLVNDFILAWQCVKNKLLTYPFPTLEGLTKIPKEFCQKPITDAHPVSVLLPTFRDSGLCAYGLLYYLLKKQNNFLQEYCKVKKLKYTELPKVQLRDVTPAHLISYHPDRDILPMVMANCHYTFQVGKGTKIDYNFGDLERQLMDRFLFSKSVIEMPVYEFEMMTYRSETTNAVVFRDLRQKIKQEPLTPVVANQICEETRTYPDICETLDKLEITISFLKSVKGDSNMFLEKFMTQTLKMENPFPSQKARSSCQCKHAQSLWITLAMEKTRRQASHKEDAFEGVVTELREELNAAQRDLITSMCEEISLERLDLLLEILFECIMLTITVPKGTDDDDVDMAKLPLQDTLLGYISAPQYDLDLNYPGWTNDVIERIPNEGAGFTPILNNQAVDTWLFLYALFTVKQSERR